MRYTDLERRVLRLGQRKEALTRAIEQYEETDVLHVNAARTQIRLA